MFGSSVQSIIFTMLIENYLTSVNLKKENGKNYPTTRKAQNGKTFYQMANLKAKTHKKNGKQLSHSSHFYNSCIEFHYID